MYALPYTGFTMLPYLLVALACIVAGLLGRFAGRRKR